MRVDRAWEHRSRKDAGRGNQQVVLREIVLSGPVSRTEIAGTTGLTAGTISRITRPLIDSGLVRELPAEHGELPSGPGRRCVPLDVDPQGGQVLGINVGPTFQTVTLADIKNRIIAHTDLGLETVEDPEFVVGSVARESRRLIGTHLGGRGRLLGGLLTVAGQVEPVRGAVVSAPYLGWGTFPLRAKLADMLDLPVKVQSVTSAVAREEMLFGETRGRGNVLMLLCGLGIGAAVILDGHLVEGSDVAAGGIGRMEAVGEDGTATTLDQLASGLGILRRLHGEAMVPDHTPLSRLARALLEAVESDRADDPDVASLMARAGRELGRVIVQFARFIRIETVRIAGPLSMSPRYVSAVGEVVTEGMGSNPAEVVASTVTVAAGGSSAGCGMAICEYLIERPLDLSRLSARAA